MYTVESLYGKKPRMPPASWPRVLRSSPIAAPGAKTAAAFLVLAACGGDSYTPTEARILPSPSPPVSAVTATFTFAFPYYASPRPHDVEVPLDGVVRFSGPLQAHYYEDYYLSGDLGALAAGRHTLSLKVTRQDPSPTTYLVSARVEAVHRVNGVPVDSQGATWEEHATLATGAAWTGVFEIREWRG